MYSCRETLIISIDIVRKQDINTDNLLLLSWELRGQKL